MRLIDADALEQIITEKFKEHYGNTAYQFIRDFFTFVIRQIRKAPTIEAEPVKHGRWIECDFVKYDRHSGCVHYPKAAWKCSNCCNAFKKELLLKDNYCPNCGAKMDGGAENEN